MLRVAFELTTPAFERTNTVHVLERAATVIGSATNHRRKNLEICTAMVMVVVIKVTICFESGNAFCWYTNSFVLEISANRMQTVGTLPQLFIPINTV
jgi:hypothetical protein